MNSLFKKKYIFFILLFSSKFLFAGDYIIKQILSSLNKTNEQIALLNGNVNFLSEQVRDKLKSQITQVLLDDNDVLNVFTFEPLLEQQLISGLQGEGRNLSLAIEPSLTDTLIQQLASYSESAISKRLSPVLVCHSPIRSAIKSLLERVIPQLHILSVTEIPHSVSVQNLGVVRNTSQKGTN